MSVGLACGLYITFKPVGGQISDCRFGVQEFKAIFIGVITKQKIYQA